MKNAFMGIFFYRPTKKTAKSTINLTKVRWLIALLFAATGSTGALAVAASPTESLQALQTRVQQHASQYYQAAKAKKTTISVNALDSRLQLRSCVNSPTITLNDPQYNGGNQTALVRCEGEAPWSIYIPLQVALFYEYPVASRNMARGDLVSAADIQTTLVNSTGQRQGQIDSAVDIIGKSLRRPIRQGEVFRSAQLEMPTVVKRGDLVSILTQVGAISVSSAGTAMSNGKIGEKIRIKNTQSERVIMAEVIEAGSVRTL